MRLGGSYGKRGALGGGGEGGRQRLGGMLILGGKQMFPRFLAYGCTCSFVRNQREGAFQYLDRTKKRKGAHAVAGSQHERWLNNATALYSAGEIACHRWNSLK